MDRDSDAINEAKRQANNRPQSLLVRTATTTNIANCVVAECKENGFDLVVLGHKLLQSAPSSAFLGSDMKQKGNDFPLSIPVRKISESSFGEAVRGSLLRKHTTGKYTMSSHEAMLGTLACRLLAGTEASLLVVGQTKLEETVNDV